MSDYVLEQDFVSDYWMHCPNCSANVSGKIKVVEPNWAGAEDISELQSEGESEIVCENCERSFACYFHFTHGDCSGYLVDYPEVDLSIDVPRFWPPEPDWYFDVPASDPHEIFKETISELKRLLKETADENGASLVNRMCFAQAVSAFEAYLADTLIIAVQNEKRYLVSLLEADSELKKQKVSLKQALDDPDLVVKIVVRHLKGLLYHNLPRINPLFEAAFAVSVYRNPTDKGELMKIMTDRHDCVHRNGKTKEGEDPSKYTSLFVTDCLRLLEAVVDDIESAVQLDQPVSDLPF